jgi:DNA-binding beta-propeller fold protein YncE
MSDVILPRQYDLVPDWEQLPAGLNHDDVVGVSSDSRDRLFILTRRESRVLIYEHDGRYAGHWGDGFFTARTHGITVAPDDSLYIVDEGVELIYHTTPEGEVLGTIGVRGVASDTGYDGVDLETIRRGAGPFNKPTNLAVAPSGDLYVSDGYGNSRVHQFDSAGEWIRSWGEPGGEPGEFHLPHGIACSPEGTVLVADRENDRIQFFSPTGVYLDQWTDVQRPTAIAVDGEGVVYVAELWRRPIEPSLRLGVTPDLPGRVSVFAPDGALLARWGGPQRTAPGNFVAPHSICVDSRGDVYVGEVSFTHGVDHGDVEPPAQSLQKFSRVR